MRFPKLVAVLACSTASCSSNASKPSTTQPTPVAIAYPAGVIPAVARVTRVDTLFVASSESAAQQAPSKVDLAAPFSLTASDGSGLQVTRVDAKAIVEGPLAFTELHLYFHNTEARTREGTFAITLPEGAAVSRFAMETDGKLVEAEVVEKQLARRAYDDFLHRRQDPALLEKAAGNQFSAKVFPIPASADKHIVIAFSQEVSPGKYTLPLRGLAKADRVDVRVQVRGKDGDLLEQTFAQRDWVADRDVVVDGTKVAAPTAVVAGDLAAARVTVGAGQAGADAPASGVTLLVDTSASRALGFAATAARVESLVGELAKQYGGALPVQVVAFDQAAQPIYDGRADGAAGAGIAAALIKRGALGASDLGQALAFVAANGAKPRVVVLTDGVMTAGDEADVLKAKIAKLAGIQRIDVALSGGIRDASAAQLVTRAGLAKTGAVLDLDRGDAEVARRIGLAVQTNIPLAVAGASWVYPKTIASAQAGDEVTVYWKLGPSQADGPGARPASGMALEVGGVATAVSAVGAEPALVERAIAGAEITEMEAQATQLPRDEAKQLRAEIVKKSVAERVVSDETSLLVLEHDSDYARYGIDRSALAEILTIGPTGIALAHRAPDPVQQQIAQEPPKAPHAVAPPKKVPPEVTAALHDIERLNAEAAKNVADMSRQQLSMDRKADIELAVRGAKLEDKQVQDQKVDLPELEKATADKDKDNAPGYAAGSAANGATAGFIGNDDVAADADAKPDPSVAAAPPPPPTSTPTTTAAPRTQPIAPAAVATHRPPAAPAQRDVAQVRYEPNTDYATGDDNDDGLAANRGKPSLTGELAAIEALLKERQVDAALERARAWHAKDPGDVLALIGLGDSLEAQHDLDGAARVYGSIIDLYPARADFRRFAGERLERVGTKQRALIIDTYRRAVVERPDHLTGHRLLAYALVQDGQFQAAFDAILAGIDQPYAPNQYAGGERVLADDAGMIGATLLAHGGDRNTVVAELAKRGSALATGPSTRFIMYWETDANDVDFHIRDARGGHAWYSHKALRSGGELYADITTGYGPECFAIPGRPAAGPYQLSINYFSQGPMGYGMGLLQIQKFDGKSITLEDRPYMIMVDQAFVDLGTYKP